MKVSLITIIKLGKQRYALGAIIRSSHINKMCILAGLSQLADLITVGRLYSNLMYIEADMY